MATSSNRDFEGGFSGSSKRDLRAAWRGERPLWFTYWVLGVAGNMSFAGALLAIYVASGPDAAVWLWLVYGASLAWFVFVFVAVWRAADRYPGPGHWPMLARAGVLIGSVRMCLEAVVLAGLPPPATWP